MLGTPERTLCLHQGLYQGHDQDIEDILRLEQNGRGGVDATFKRISSNCNIMIFDQNFTKIYT